MRFVRPFTAINAVFCVSHTLFLAPNLFRYANVSRDLIEFTGFFFAPLSIGTFCHFAEFFFLTLK